MNRSRAYLFFLMFSIILLLNIDFTILKSVRNTLAVVDLGRGAGSIPLFELFGALPGSIAMTWGMARLMNRCAIRHVFSITMTLFLSFFLLFAWGLYPYLKGANSWELQACSMVFYVVSELWKPALIVILFWGLINQHMPMGEAKKRYASLMLGASIGALLAGPIISACTSLTLWEQMPFASERWAHAFTALMSIVAALGWIVVYLYDQLWHHLSQQATNSSDTHHTSLQESLTVSLGSPPLRLLAWIVIADYIAYSLGEVIFLDVLKRKFPDACDYCSYVGALSAWGGALTVLCALFVAPILLQRHRWVIAALATPICLLATEGAFFLVLRCQQLSCSWFGWTEATWISVVVLLGSLQYCLCRATKYTLFDASKELAFVEMPADHKMKGKLVIDGICARLGRGGASALSLCLIRGCGGVIASAYLAGIFAIATGISWLFTTRKLGRLLEKETAVENIHEMR